ncbi:MAG TPA: DUF4136 domain-containing protein [Psychromonas sp.]
MLRIILPVLLSFAMLGCSAKPVTDFAVAHDFSQYKTFAFVAPSQGAVASIDSSRIESAVATQLNKKGVNQTEFRSADLLVDYHIDSATELEPYGGSVGVGMGIFHRGSIGISTPPRYRERKYGKLVLEFSNPKSKSIIWRSVSQRRLTETMSAEKRANFIMEEIALMLKNYPPQAK